MKIHIKSGLKEEFKVEYMKMGINRRVVKKTTTIYPRRTDWIVESFVDLI